MNAAKVEWVVTITNKRDETETIDAYGWGQDQTVLTVILEPPPSHGPPERIMLNVTEYKRVMVRRKETTH